MPGPSTSAQRFMRANLEVVGLLKLNRAEVDLFGEQGLIHAAPILFCRASSLRLAAMTDGATKRQDTALH